MHIPHTRGLGLCLGALVAVTCLVSTASAQPPPPPDFWGFQIRNNCGQSVTDIEVKLFVPNAQQAPCDLAVEMAFDDLAHGRTLNMSLPKTHGIVRIQVTAKRGGRTATVEIQSVRGNFDGKAGLEWAGFTSRITQCNPPKTSRLEVEFRAPSGQYATGSACLRGRPYWDGPNWAALEVEKCEPFQY